MKIEKCKPLNYWDYKGNPFAVILKNVIEDIHSRINEVIEHINEKERP